MSLSLLRADNTKRAKVTAINTFKRYLEGESVELNYVLECIGKDSTGKLIAGVMDKFGMHLAFFVSTTGKPLARNSVMSYFRHVKLWLLDLFSNIRAAAEAKLMNMGSVLER
jgi:hypothetical protein